MLSRDVREALGAELEHLRIRRKKLTERIDRKISAIEALLVPGDGDEDREQHVLPLDPPAGSACAPGPLTGRGCREAIKIVLSSYPNIKTTEVATKLEEMGWKPSGTTPVKVRVASEIHRMRKNKLIIKRGNRLSLAPTPEETAPDPHPSGMAAA